MPNGSSSWLLELTESNGGGATRGGDVCASTAPKHPCIGTATQRELGRSARCLEKSPWCSTDPCVTCLGSRRRRSPGFLERVCFRKPSGNGWLADLSPMGEPP